jgi:hypothetical protein
LRLLLGTVAKVHSKDLNRDIPNSGAYSTLSFTLHIIVVLCTYPPLKLPLGSEDILLIKPFAIHPHCLPVLTNSLPVLGKIHNYTHNY